MITIKKKNQQYRPSFKNNKIIMIQNNKLVLKQMNKIMMKV